MVSIDFYELGANGSEKLVNTQKITMSEFVKWISVMTEMYKPKFCDTEISDMCRLETAEMKYVCRFVPEEEILSNIVWTGKNDVLNVLDSGCYDDILHDMSDKEILDIAEEISDRVDWNYIAEVGIVAGNEALDHEICEYLYTEEEKV